MQVLGKGLYEIPEEYLTKQPRVSMGVMLRETPDNNNHQAFIQACLAKDESLIRGNVLKADAKRLPKLLEILEDDDKKDPGQRNWFREYLSECIRMQYVSNY
jgi:hypothetical protein